MKREFKVGDKVKIVNKTGNWNDVGKMDKWFGKIMTIREVGINHVRMEEDIKEGNYGRGWVWNFKCLELIESNNNSKSIHITFDNNNTHAVLKDGKEVIKHVKVGLYNEDEYKFEAGVMEVVKKLLEIKDEKNEVVEDGNFSARCIRNDYDDCGLTIGKIYKFVDGYSKWDDDVKMPNFKDNEIERFRNIEDLEKWFGDADGYEFELVDENEAIQAPKKFVKAKVGDKIRVVKYIEYHMPKTRIGDIHIVEKVNKMDIETNLENVFSDVNQEYEIIEHSEEQLSDYSTDELLAEIKCRIENLTIIYQRTHTTRRN